MGMEDLTSPQVRRAQVALGLLKIEGARALVIGRHEDAESLAISGGNSGTTVLRGHHGHVPAGVFARLWCGLPDDSIATPRVVARATTAAALSGREGHFSGHRFSGDDRTRRGAGATAGGLRAGGRRRRNRGSIVRGSGRNRSAPGQAGNGRGDPDELEAGDFRVLEKKSRSPRAPTPRMRRSGLWLGRWQGSENRQECCVTFTAPESPPRSRQDR